LFMRPTRRSDKSDLHEAGSDNGYYIGLRWGRWGDTRWGEGSAFLGRHRGRGDTCHPI
jgi:hypothetical protein